MTLVSFYDTYRLDIVSSEDTAAMNWVKYARKKMNMTQKEFAQALGVTRVTVARWESNRVPSIVVLYKIAGLLGLDPSVVLKGDY